MGPFGGNFTKIKKIYIICIHENVFEIFGQQNGGNFVSAPGCWGTVDCGKTSP